MKKILIFIIIILPFASCEDFLAEIPKDRLTEVNYYKSIEDAIGAVNSIYDPVRQNFRTQYMWMMDVQADYAYGRGSLRPVGEYQGFDQTNINRAQVNWLRFYQSIRNANIAIEQISNMEINESAKNELIAEARFMRAFNYFHLVRNFGPVPLYLETVTEDTGRKPGEEIYQAIISDLQAGETDLPSTPKQFGRPSKWAAKSLLAEVYLTIQEYSLAKERAKEVIDSEIFELVEVSTEDDFNKIFGPSANGTKEEIFYIKYNHQDGWSYPMNLLWDKTEWGPFGNFILYSVPGPFHNNWDSNDLRKKWNVFSEYINRNTGELETLPEATPILCSKYRDPDAASREGYANDYPRLRFADVLLIHAEASALDENTVSPVSVESLNKIKRRAYGYPSNSPSPVDFPNEGWTVDSFRDTILQERAYEFYMEGKRWFDLIRTGKVKEIVFANTGKTVQDIHLLWPIPQQEIDTNPDISQEDQNPGY